MVNLEEKTSTKKRNRGHKKRIGFTEETVTRDEAESLLSTEQGIEADAKAFRTKLENEENMNHGSELSSKKSKKRKLKVQDQDKSSNNSEINSEPILKKRKEKSLKIESEDVTENDEIGNEKTEKTEVEDDAKVGGIKSNTSLSKRALKRQKHQDFRDAKKVEMETKSQINALNYLSKWKYNRSEWKFEKKRQVWLANYLYDGSKIEDKYWDTLVEYFNNSQGKVRSKIQDEAIKIIENDEIEKNDPLKFKRAKELVQSIA